MIQGEQALQRRLSAIASDQGSMAAFKRLGAITVSQAQRYTAPNRKSGNLQREIGVEELDARHVKVASNANYSAALELGTKPHKIKAKHRKALRFASTKAGARLSGSPRRGSAVTFVTLPRVVNHPGTKAYPFMRPAYQDAKRASAGVFRDAITVFWNGAA